MAHKALACMVLAVIAVAGILLGFSKQFAKDPAAKARTLSELRVVLGSQTEKTTVYASPDGRTLCVLPLRTHDVVSGPAAVLFDKEGRKIAFITELGEGSRTGAIYSSILRKEFRVGMLSEYPNALNDEQ